MIALVDTNVLLDYVLYRDMYYNCKVTVDN